MLGKTSGRFFFKRFLAYKEGLTRNEEIDLQRIRFLIKSRGSTPSKISADIYNAQKRNPIKYTDQFLAEEYNFSVDKVRGVIKLQEHVNRWYNEKKMEEAEKIKLERENSEIKSIFGEFSLKVLKESRTLESLYRFRQLVVQKKNKYQLSEGLAEKFDLELENGVKEEEEEIDEKVKEEIFKTGVVPGTDDTVTAESLQRYHTEDQRRKDNPQEIIFKFVTEPYYGGKT